MAYENIWHVATSLPDHPRSPNALLSSVKENCENGGTFNHVVLDREGKNIAIKMPVSSTVLNLIKTAQMDDAFLQKEACSKVITQAYVVT